MGGQGIERREILRYIGIAAVASSFPGFSGWAFACPQDHAQSHVQSPSANPDPYQPLFFSPQQYRMVEHLAEMIIPEDDTPGAKRAGVTEFIDFMLANRVPVSTSRDLRSTDDAIAAGNEAQNKFIAGLGWMKCAQLFGIRSGVYGFHARTATRIARGVGLQGEIQIRDREWTLAPSPFLRALKLGAARLVFTPVRLDCTSLVQDYHSEEVLIFG